MQINHLRKIAIPLFIASFLLSACSSNSSVDGNLDVTDLTIGTGDEVENLTTIIISWEGRLPDGSVFDSSVLRGEDLIFTLGASKVIKGLDKGILGMRIGGRRLIEIPPNLAFGRTGTCLGDGSCPVPGNTTVTYQVDLKSRMTTVLIDEREEGVGLGAVSGDLIDIDYVGTTQAGSIFDSSESHGGPLEFRLGQAQVIEGWDIGITGMKPGGVRILTIPPELAYGANRNGPLVPWSVLIFRVELVTIVDEG